MVVSNNAKMDDSSLSVEKYELRIVQQKIDGLKEAILKGHFEIQEYANRNVERAKHYAMDSEANFEFLNVESIPHIITQVEKYCVELRSLKEFASRMGLSQYFKW